MLRPYQARFNFELTSFVTNTDASVAVTSSSVTIFCSKSKLGPAVNGSEGSASVTAASVVVVGSGRGRTDGVDD